MADLTVERLAEILWTARSRAREIPDPIALPKKPAYTRERYLRFAVEVERLLGPERSAEVEQLRGEVRDRTEAEAYALNRVHDAREALINELRASSRFRKAWQSARRGRRIVRNYYRHEIAVADDYRERLRRAEAERDDAQRAAAVLQSATDEANRRINAALRTAADLHEFNSPKGEHLDGCPGCRLETELGEARPDPRTEALEALAVRYPAAFEWLLADAQARATRKETTP